jgi:replicative DNA helicase
MTSALFKKINFIIKNPAITSDAAIEEIKLLLASEEKNQGSIQPTELAAELISRKAEQLKNPFSNEKVYLTGFDAFDANFKGFYPGELIVIGGRPGMGKTALMINLALNLSLQTPLVFMSMDIPANILSNRILSSLTGIQPDHIRDNKINEEELTLIENSKSEILKRLLYINDTLFSNLMQLSDYIRDMATEENIKIFFIDYLQLLNNPRHRGYNRDQEINDIMRELKGLCKELNITIVLSSQLSRNVEMRGGDKQPQLSDLRESGSIEQSADKVILIYRHEYYKLYYHFDDELGSTMNITLAKNRNGSVGEIILKHNLYLTQFENFESEQQEFKIKPKDDAHPWE